MARLNIIAGPGAGKSTKAAWLYSQLKIQNFSVELIGEYVKAWASQDREVKKYDQYYLFGKQQQYEYRHLSFGVKNIVTDSPTFMSSIYAEIYHGAKYAKPLEMMDDLYEEEYPSYSMFIDRTGMEYVTEGRFETESQAIDVDNAILKKMKTKKRNFEIFKWNDFNAILQASLKVIDE